jgi:hypothetical protein
MTTPVIYRFLSPAQIAAGTGISIEEIVASIEAGVLPAAVHGGKYAVRGQDLIPWLANLGITQHTLNLRHDFTFQVTRPFRDEI